MHTLQFDLITLMEDARLVGPTSGPLSTSMLHTLPKKMFILTFINTPHSLIHITIKTIEKKSGSWSNLTLCSLLQVIVQHEK